MRQKKEGLEYLPTTGVRADLKRFMNKFLEYNTVRFEQFAEVWRDKKLGYLCAGRATDREAREFLERVLQIGQEYFLPPYQFQVRVGGLYLLYAIYQIQPINPKVKIRLTPCQWQDSVFFQQQAAQQNHLDVVYVFQRLLQEQAFLFCYTPSEMSLHSAMKDTDEMVDDLADTLKEEKTAVTSLFNYESLEKLSYFQDQYQQMKIGLAGPKATAPDKSLAVVQTELVEDVVVLLQSFKEKVSSLSRQGQKFEAANRDNDPLETTGSRRQMLKSMAYSQLGAQTNKRQSLVAVSASSTSPAKASLPEMRWEKMRLGDQRRTAVEEEAAGESSTELSPAKAGPQVSVNNMPIIDTTDQDVDNHHSPWRHLVHTKSSSREVLAEQNAGREQPAQTAPAVRKRGRPKKYPELTWVKESHGAQINKQTHLGQENCSQRGAAPVARKNDHAVSECKDGALVKQKMAVKSDKIGNKVEEILQQNAAEIKNTPRRRGRPRKCDLLTRGQAVNVCSDEEHNAGGKKAKYELVYFPTGMTSALHTSSYSTDWTTLRATLNEADVQSGSLSQTGTEITSKLALAQDWPSPRAVTPRAADVQKAKVGRQSESRPGTVTEIVVGKEIGKPAVVQSQVVHKAVHVRDKLAQSPHKDSVPASENGSATADSADERHSPVKGLSNADDAFYRRRERFKRRLVEADTELVAQSVRAVDEEINSLQPASTTPRKQSSANDSIRRLKERCKRQLEEGDRQSVIHYVKRRLTEERDLNHLQLVSTTEQKTVVREPSVKPTQHKSPVLNEPPVTLQKKGDIKLLYEPSVKSQQKTGVFSEPSVKPKQNNKPSAKPQQNTVVLSKLLDTPAAKLHKKAVGLSESPLKCQQLGLSEQPAVKSQKTVALTKLLSQPPEITHQLSVSAHSEGATSDESPHKVSETKNLKTVSKGVLPPWTSKRQSSSQQSTSKKHHFSPKIRERTSVDPASVQFRFL
ncbi:hypothetical protein BsWGS_00012 [Bradybaena similaris]